MSGDAHDPASAARPDHDPIFVWNGLVTRVRRSVGERQDGKLTSTTFASRGRAPGTAAKTRQADLGSGTSNELVPERTPIDPDLA
jgi:hypothetical protein